MKNSDLIPIGKMQNKLSTVNLIIFSIFSLFLMLLIISCTSQTRKDFDTYVTYYNNHDFKQRMTLYSDTAKFELINGWLKIGKEKIGKY
jgi:energy-converting hydrogenase Eha subunit H